MKTLELVKSRIASAICQETAKAQVAREEAETLCTVAQELRQRLMSNPEYRTYDGGGDKTPEAMQITQAYDARDKRSAEARQHELEAAAYARLSARVFGGADEYDGMPFEGRP